MKKMLIMLFFVTIFMTNTSNILADNGFSDFTEVTRDGLVFGASVNINGHHYEEIQFRKDIRNQTIRLISVKTKESTLVIPSEIEGCPVTSIGARLGEVAIYNPERIPDVGQLKSMLLWNIDEKQKYEKIVIPEGVQQISELGFLNTKAKKIELPQSLKKIGEVEKASSMCFRNAEIDNIVVKNKKLDLGDVSLSRSKVKKVTFPKNYEGKIGMGAFEESAIESFTWPSYKSGASKKIGHGIFKNCKKLKKVVFPKNQAHIYIPNSTFYGCTKLKKLTFPASTKKVTYRWHAYAENYKMGPQTLEFKGKKTKLEGAEFEYKKNKKTLLTVSKIIVPPKSKALAYAKKAKKIKSFSRTTKWRMKDHESVEHNYADEDGDGVLKLTKLKYVIRK